MLIKEILQKLDLGNSVAEYDAALERYFVETNTFRAMIGDEGDVIAGDKGTGKTALFRILKRRYASIDELANVELVEAFNPSGNPVFQRLTETEPLEEGQYVTIWKAYIIALVGNWALELYEDDWTESMHDLDALLTSVGLRSTDDSPTSVFSQLVNLFRRITNPKAVEMAITITPEGIPIIAPRIEFGDAGAVPDKLVRHDDALGLLNRVLDEVDITVWVAFDRLDEAFQGFPSAEIPALRALFRTYLDLNAFERVRLKLFVRKDLFGRIIAAGFVNLTHINARKIEIVWDEEDLFDLLFRRIKENDAFLSDVGIEEPDANGVFGAVFIDQVDPGERKPKTWTWMMARIRDGNGIRPPRNLIDLVKKAQEEQLRREERTDTEYESGNPLIGSDALKKGLARLSTERVQDTLLAEAGEQYAVWIERFRDGRAEHNQDTIAATLRNDDGAEEPIRVLKDLGFIEPVGATYKVPMLYRAGLNITQGKAFAPDEQASDADE